MNVPEIADKINDLYSIIRKTCASPIDIADKINCILIYGDGIPRQLLSSAWDFFAKQKGVERSGVDLCE